MPDDAAPARLGDDVRSAEVRERPCGDAAPENPESLPPDFPADVRILPLGAANLADGAARPARFLLSNPHPSAVLHVRLSVSAASAWLRVSPVEVALGPGERQAAEVRADAGAARAAVQGGAAPAAPLQLTFQRLVPGGHGTPPSPTGTGAVYVRLPFATCPACQYTLDDDLSDGVTAPDVCPRCFERLRPCPVCGAPNSWLARRCVIDPSHVVRAAPDWPCVGGGPEHAGNRSGERANASLSRRWSFPSVPPSRREDALLWSAPVAAYGLVAASAATSGGEAHLYAFETTKGAPIWEPYPLPDPVYPERGGAAIANGRLFAATVEGVVAGVDAQRGTRIWETSLAGRVYGALVPAPGEDGPLLVPVATSGGGGCLSILEAATGRVLHQVPLGGPPDSAPAASGNLAFVHDDAGTLTAVEWRTGRVRWTAACGANFDAAPTVVGERVFSATTAGSVFCHDAGTGAEVWRAVVTGVPFGGTPAGDGTLLYAPADDGVHLLSMGAGRAIRRYGLNRPVRGAPIFAGGILFFGATDGNVYGVDANRSLQTLYETGRGSQIAAAPALADGALFVAATNGVLYALAVG